MYIDNSTILPTNNNNKNKIINRWNNSTFQEYNLQINSGN